jgi:hypothetical protein
MESVKPLSFPEAACHCRTTGGAAMDVSALVPGLVGACVGSIGWLFVGLYINRRTSLAAARNSARAVFFELEANRVSVDLARTYSTFNPLSRSSYEQLLPQLANLLAAADLATVASAYMAHVGYEQLRLTQHYPDEARAAALEGILGAQRTAIECLKRAAFSPAEQAQIPAMMTL